MKVTLNNITQNIENEIVRIARVSSSRKNKNENPEGLINYLIKNKHWSPFEHGFISFSIETSKAIGIQLIRHRSFSFQEFSQRYQNVERVGEKMFEPIDIRKQSENNRQSSTESFNPLIKMGDIEAPAQYFIQEHLEKTSALYEALLEGGVAREQARMVLPMATMTRIHMSGTVRSWIHFLEIRDDSHAQLEIQLIAKEIKKILIKELPIITNALGWVV